MYYQNTLKKILCYKSNTIEVNFSTVFIKVKATEYCLKFLVKAREIMRLLSTQGKRNNGFHFIYQDLSSPEKYSTRIPYMEGFYLA